MSATEREPAGAPAVAEAPAPSFIDQAIAATRQTEPDRLQAMLRTLADQALQGTVRFDKNLTVTINKAIAAIDRKMSEQLAAIMHHEKFRKLEGSWRGLHYLVSNSETGTGMRIRMLNAKQREIYKDLTKASEFDQSRIFKKIYEEEFEMPGGAPYGALIGDYEFTNHAEDVEFLRLMSGVAAAAFAPFISAASAGMFGLEDYTELAKPRDLAKGFGGPEFAAWNAFRESDDSRFVVLTMPRVLARPPYGARTRAIEEFDYEEAPRGRDGEPLPMDHENYCWMNAAYALGVRLTSAFAEYGWCTAIRGAESGGKVENLPVHTFVTDEGDMEQKTPTEIGINGRRENELSGLGFLPLCHYKNTTHAVFYGAQTVQKPKKYDRPDASANAEISARLPYVMATSRIAHYLKVMARDKVGSFMEKEDCEAWLNRWVNNYVNSNERADAEMKARYPLREAKVEVREVPGKPGAYNAVAHLRPWLQFEQLTASLRMVAKIPGNG